MDNFYFRHFKKELDNDLFSCKFWLSRHFQIINRIELSFKLAVQVFQLAKWHHLVSQHPFTIRRCRINSKTIFTVAFECWKGAGSRLAAFSYWRRSLSYQFKTMVYPPIKFLVQQQPLNTQFDLLVIFYSNLSNFSFLKNDWLAIFRYKYENFGIILLICLISMENPTLVDDSIFIVIFANYSKF